MMETHKEDIETPTECGSLKSECQNPRTGGDPGVALSVISKQYDRHGKGYLDEGEKGMRAMDSDNKGYLNTDQIHALVDSKIAADQQSKTFKKFSLILVVLVILLAVSNIGTAYLAVSLSKDTKLSTNGVLVSNGADGVEVTVKGKGSTINLTFDTYDADLDERGACLTPGQVGQLYTDVTGGVATRVLVTDPEADDSDGDETSTGFSSATRNSTHTCFNTAGGSMACVVFASTACGNDGADPETRRRLAHGGLVESEGRELSWNGAPSCFVRQTWPNLNPGPCKYC